MAEHEQPEAGWRRFVAEAGKTGGLPAAPVSEVVAPTPLAGAPHISPSFDVIERLPEERKDLFRKICQRADDACALAVPFEEVRLASMDRVEKENELRRLTSHPQDFGFDLKPDDARVILAQQALTKATENFRRVQELQAERAAAQQAALRVKAACEDFLRYGVPGNCQIAVIEVEEPKLLKNEGLMDGIARFQRRGREIKATIHTIQSSCFPKDYCKSRAREMVEALAERGAISVSRLVEHDGDLEFPSLQQRAMVHNATPGAVAYHEAVDVAGLLAFLLKPTMIAALDRLIDEEADDAGLSHEERQRRESEALSDLLSVEFSEAELVWRAWSENLPCQFRPDLDVRAILQIQLITVPRATELPPSSPERAGYNLIGRGR